MCKFCGIYAFAKEKEEKSRIQKKYYVVMREINIVNGRDKGVLNHSPVKLVYCPLCGNKL